MNGTKNALDCRANITLGVLGMLAGVVGASAQAEEIGSNYVMTVISNQAQGERVISGEYEEAIEDIVSPERERGDRFAESNNLCVAYAKGNQLEKAARACDEAVRKSRLAAAFGHNEAFGRNEDRAVALSNRGVLRAISGDQDAAREDFILALRMNSRLDAPAENLAHLEVETRTVSSLQVGH